MGASPEAINLLRKIDLSLDGGEQLQHIEAAFMQMRHEWQSEREFLDGYLVEVKAEAKDARRQVAEWYKRHETDAVAWRDTLQRIRQRAEAAEAALKKHHTDIHSWCNVCGEH